MFRIFLAPLVVCGAAACADLAAPPPAQLAAASTALRLAAEDRVRVTAFDEPRVTGEYRVGRDGVLDLPLVGMVAAADRTPYEVERSIETSLRNRAPHRETPVAVEILGTRGGFVTALR